MTDQDVLDLALGRMIRVLVEAHECGITIRKPDGDEYPAYVCVYGQAKGGYDAFANDGQTLDEAIKGAYGLCPKRE